MMQDEKDDQALVSAVLASRLATEVPADFLARVNARIDALQDGDGWFALADFRAWTLGLVPIAGVLALIGFLWPAESTSAPPPAAPSAQVQSTPMQPFTPTSAIDWQRDVTANALLDAALHHPGETGAR
jgi:hypothetical protein